MEHFEMVEKLVEKSGASYAAAKEALEKSNWDLLDAMILLENEKGAGNVSGRYTSDAGEPEADGTESEYRSAPAQRGGTGEKIKEVLKKVWAFMIGNKMTVSGRDGDMIFTVPVLVVIILLIASVGTVVLAAIVAMFFGLRFSFEGPDLGSDSVNNAARAVGDKMADIGQDIHAKYEEFRDRDDSSN